jgi:hypothetical protein
MAGVFRKRGYICKKNSLNIIAGSLDFVLVGVVTKIYKKRSGKNIFFTGSLAKNSTSGE